MVISCHTTIYLLNSCAIGIHSICHSCGNVCFSSLTSTTRCMYHYCKTNCTPFMTTMGHNAHGILQQFTMYTLYHKWIECSSSCFEWGTNSPTSFEIDAHSINREKLILHWFTLTLHVWVYIDISNLNLIPILTVAKWSINPCYFPFFSSLFCSCSSSCPLYWPYCFVSPTVNQHDSLPLNFGFEGNYPSYKLIVTQ